MAGPSKVTFTLSELQEAAKTAAEQRVAEAEAYLARVSDRDAHEAKEREWIDRIANALGPVARAELDAAEAYGVLRDLPARPTWDEYTINKARRMVREAADERDSIIAKATALSPDEDGKVALTKHQLKEFFGL